MRFRPNIAEARPYFQKFTTGTVYSKNLRDTWYSTNKTFKIVTIIQVPVLWILVSNFLDPDPYSELKLG